MTMLEEEELQASRTLQPILDLATGADGGLAFLDLRSWLAARYKHPGLGQPEVINAIEDFSFLCSAFLEEYGYETN